jgi:hypothetical protein
MADSAAVIGPRRATDLARMMRLVIRSCSDLVAAIAGVELAAVIVVGIIRARQVERMMSLL